MLLSRRHAAPRPRASAPPPKYPSDPSCKMTTSDLQGIYKMLTRENLVEHVDPATFCEYLAKNLDISQSFIQYLEGYKIIKVYGRGVYGVVFQMCKKSNPFECRALKLQIKPDDQFEVDRLLNEKNMQYVLAGRGMAPEIEYEPGIGTLRVYDQLDTSKRDIKVPVMLFRMMPIKTTLQKALFSEKYDLTNFDQLLRGLLTMFKVKTEVKIIHGDMHADNIALDNQDKIELIDFGFTSQTQGPSYEGFVDFIPLIGSIISILKELKAKGKNSTVNGLLIVAGLLMISCNFLFGTSFTELNHFTPMARGGYEYKTPSYSISSYTSLESSIRSSSGALVKIGDLHWDNLKAPTEEDFDYLIGQSRQGWLNMYKIVNLNEGVLL